MVSAKDKNEFVQKLTRLLTDYSGFQEPRRKLSAAMGQFARENLIDRYDEELEKPVRMSVKTKSDDRNLKPS